ncbi:MAG: CRISPR-associated endonuclease Cas1 [Methanothrix sp.]|nr:CRISPR-associated endonuclease Cas1 [Methanothrix sp.]
MDENSRQSAWMPDLIPASMVSDYAYCPRQCYIRWNEGEFQECEDAANSADNFGSSDSPDSISIAGAGRTVYLSAPKLGLTSRINLMEGQGGARDVMPVLVKKGEATGLSGEVYESDRVRLCAQALVLRENGFLCEAGLAYFCKSRKSVPVHFDEPLIARTEEIIAGIKAMAADRRMPLPLLDSPKCNRCTFGGICLPDEVNFLREQKAGKSGAVESKNGSEDKKELRMLLASRDDQVPVYVLDQGSTVHKRGDCLEIRSREGKVGTVRMIEVSQLCLYGGVEISTPAVVELLQRGIPVLHFTPGGWVEGICLGHTSKNIDLRIQQYEWSRDREKSLALARGMISGKIRNCRILLRRNDEQIPAETLERLAEYACQAERAESLQTLLGVEGAAAELYFSRLGWLLKTGDDQLSFQGRNRRPPRDPVNAVMSYLYGILAKECFVTLLAVGFEPYLGFYHQPKYGRPALALDLMEEFRPLIADSTMVSLFNNKELTVKDFVITEEGVMIGRYAKRKVVAGYERRMDANITHPLFGYKISYRRILEVQSRILARVLSGEIKEYTAFCTR